MASSSFIARIHALPTGVVGNVLKHIPRNDTAQLIHDAWQSGHLNLKYLRRFQISDDDCRNEIFGQLAPSVCGSTVYGDEDAPMLIIRTHISVGERIRLRVNAVNDSTNCG